MDFMSEEAKELEGSQAPVQSHMERSQAPLSNVTEKDGEQGENRGRIYLASRPGVKAEKLNAGPESCV